VNFLIDAQLSPNLVLWLRAKGHQAEHVYNLDRLTSDDRLIWKHALDKACVIVTKDKDFVRFSRQSSGPQILFISLRNASNTQLLSSLELNWQSIFARLSENQAVVELR
jgi:predicted nuclease of predicted toxin-antitoxin system